MNIKFKKLTPTAIAPTKAHSTDAGFDLYTDEMVSIPPRSTKVISTGIALELPAGKFADNRPRSGVTSKTKLRVQYGTIDQSYRGDIGIICDNIGDKTEYVEKGTKLAQLVIQYLPSVTLTESDELNDGERGANGFGSTDKEG